MKPRHGDTEIRRRGEVGTQILRNRESHAPGGASFPIRLMLSLLIALVLLPSLTKAQQQLGPVESISASPRLPVSESPAIVTRVDAVGMTVSDMDRSVDFFSKVLSFEKVSDVEVAGEDYEHLQGLFGLRMRIVRMKLGEEFITLTEYLAPKGRPIPVDSRSNDRWFQHIAIITSDMDKAYAWLRRNKVEHASSGPQRLPDWNKNASGIKAFYFHDPDGHNLEILEFPAGKGDAKWHRPSDKLFLGIDHTAIVVSDTEASLKFYRDVLGMRIAGESENYGVEQEHLNNVFGARLRITSMRAINDGPGIEFLEYLAPRNGRAFPADERASDVVHWQTTLRVNNAEAAALSLRANRSMFVSPGLVQLGRDDLGFTKALLVRDPDGHVMELIESKSQTARKN
jgi:catechol 2,3-dioxygenase-like lactoylglutathione lyase family enzyme